MSKSLFITYKVIMLMFCSLFINIATAQFSTAVPDLRGPKLFVEQPQTSNVTSSIFMIPGLAVSSYNWLTVDKDCGLFWSDGLNPGSKNKNAGLVIAPWSGSKNGIRITPDGNVGIGVSLLPDHNPKDYKLAVNGTIGAKEINVEITSNTWSDFVFKKEYRLMPLNEVETYINLNQHLPLIPCANEVEKNGVNVGELMKLQMEKIEELTLYIIEQNKRIETLEKQIAK